MFLNQPGLLTWACFGLVTLTYVIGRTLLSGFRNPLSHVPGPWYTRFTHYVLKYQTMTGNRMYYVDSLHARYGPVVRVSSYQVAVADPNEFNTIHRIGSGFLKTPWYEAIGANSGFGIGLFHIIDPKIHGPRRKLFARALSAANIRQNCQGVVREKVVKAVDKIRAEAAGGSADILKWLLLMTSDVIGQLSFGESFGLLESGKINHYIKLLQMATLSGVLCYELPTWICKTISRIPIKAVQRIFGAGTAIQLYSSQGIEKMLKQQDNKANIFSRMLAECNADTEHNLSVKDIQIEANNIMLAGADTIATTLTYLVWTVLKKPELQARLEAEVAAVDESTLLDDAALEKLPLLNAVIEENLRLHSSIQTNLSRMVPAQGVTFGRYFIPGGFEVETQAYTLHRDPDVWPKPLE
ncbi:putative sterigmatocystin biosynthesis P450 monooxygenase STCB [Colletotrichum spinosum]|uniref:Putative sterigmatocystin biosynthesis P450 monooxygenase STCB n=1 Tax=Colletotrichum spinosum TaxID=1347390 RepID=A0A4V3HS60_9PEZI|nr:putative sterigmatocystin biosynthesis P450 monooxygenase STCB [Colletotrichum spinosum]